MTPKSGDDRDYFTNTRTGDQYPLEGVSQHTGLARYIVVVQDGKKQPVIHKAVLADEHNDALRSVAVLAVEMARKHPKTDKWVIVDAARAEVLDWQNGAPTADVALRDSEPSLPPLPPPMRLETQGPEGY